MRSFRAKPVGWKNESHRHYLAAKGITTKKTKQKKYFYTPTFIAGDLAPIAADGVGTAGAAVIPWIPIAVPALLLYGGAKYVKNKKDKTGSYFAENEDNRIELIQDNRIKKNLTGEEVSVMSRTIIDSSEVKDRFEENFNKLEGLPVNEGNVPVNKGESPVNEEEVPANEGKVQGIGNEVNIVLQDNFEDAEPSEVRDFFNPFTLQDPAKARGDSVEIFTPKLEKFPVIRLNTVKPNISEDIERFDGKYDIGERSIEKVKGKRKIRKIVGKELQDNISNKADNQLIKELYLIGDKTSEINQLRSRRSKIPKEDTFDKELHASLIELTGQKSRIESELRSRRATK